MAKLKTFIPNQASAGELRVAMVPPVAKRLGATGIELLVESRAGLAAGYDDDAYRNVGAQIVGSDGWGMADIVLVASPPSIEQAGRMRDGAALAGLLAPHRNLPLVEALAHQGVSAMSLEYVPRITRAQSMDALSSQANLAGYKAVIMAAERSTKIFPLLMTAAGTLRPAEVFVIGAGVAGLQAIATARRLGAVVRAYDVRPAVKEQVQSVGAKFVELPLEIAGAQDAGGYAKELSPEQQRRQSDLVADAVAASDVVITTAAVPGKPAPKLIAADAVARMQPGSVIVDLAAESGGNCQLTEPGQTVVKHGVTIIGITNVAATVPSHASQVYANNLSNLLKVLVTADGALKIDTADEIVAAILICHGGQIVHQRIKELVSHA